MFENDRICEFPQEIRKFRETCSTTNGLLDKSSEVFMAEINFDIVKHYGVLSEGKGGWKKELNLVAWNNRNPKLDVREWSPDHEKMGKGITLTPEEAAKLAELLTQAR
jgi:hypothetical protein